MQRGLDVNQEDARSFSEGLAAFEKHVEDNNGDPYVPRGHFTENGFALGAWATKQLVDWRMGHLSVEQQYMLWETKFSPAAHPESREAREITIAIETVLREAQLFPDSRKRAVFRALLTKYHPGHRIRGIEPPFADEVTQFLAGYRVAPSSVCAPNMHPVMIASKRKDKSFSAWLHVRSFVTQSCRRRPEAKRCKKHIHADGAVRLIQFLDA
ncbi:UCHL3 [Symbiodinium microadriaticum]|nr:UCHL3 [Symbiodinium microadriaticum]